MFLELLRRLGAAYDDLLHRRFAHCVSAAAKETRKQTRAQHADAQQQQQENEAKKDGTTKYAKILQLVSQDRFVQLMMPATPAGRFRPGVGEQMVRAALHMAYYVVAYVVMLLAMSYNGYILFSIFIGAFLGFMLFQWRPLQPVAASAETASRCG